MEIIGSVKWLQMVEGVGVKNGGEWWRLVDIVVESGGNAMER